MLNSSAASQKEECILAARRHLDAWLEAEAFQGWDPFDALNSPLLKKLSFGSRRMGQLWVQLFKRCPVNLRPLLKVPKGCNPKAMGLFLHSYGRKYFLWRDAGDLERLRFLGFWLQDHTSPCYQGAAWGYNFDWPNRSFFAPAGTPNLVSTAFIGLAFLSLLDLELDPTLLGFNPLQNARSACEFILRDLFIDRSSKGERCFSYTPLDRRTVHNANVLGAWLLAGVGRRTGEPELLQAALESARYTARRQRADGSWPYGEAPGDGWVDNFHTGYVLCALKRLGDLLCNHELELAAWQGYCFWKKKLFLSDGTPKYYLGRVHPLDAHCTAQVVLTFLEFSGQDPKAAERAGGMARWAVEHLQDPKGFFHYQIHLAYIIRIPYLRWAQAWMLRALTEFELSYAAG